jgi:hypothetical protein
MVSKIWQPYFCIHRVSSIALKVIALFSLVKAFLACNRLGKPQLSSLCCQATKDLKAKEAENSELMGMCDALLARQEAVAGDTQGSQDQA